MFKHVLRILSKLLQPLMLIAVLALILAAAISWFGDRVGYRGIYPFGDEDVRAFTVAALLVLAGVLLTFMLLRFLFRWWQDWRARKNQAAADPTPEDVEATAMDRVFASATSIIVRRWMGGGRGAYGLPWYLVIGPKHSGKSSIIDSSDLRFPIDHEISSEIAALGPSQAADAVRWRVAGNEAVLIDVNGDFFGESRENDSVRQVIWSRFLDNLHALRPRRPVNGAILALDFAEFAAMSYGERERLAADVRREFNEIVERLGTEITIHIVFTKIDLAAGFLDYFDSLTSAEREKLFGFHFLYEGKHTTSWTEQFAESYKEYIKEFQLHLKKWVFTLKNTRNRQEAFSLFRTFLGLEVPLTTFLNDALAPDKFTMAPLVRGIYFASTRQENVPRNLFLESVSERYNIHPPLYGSSQAASYPFFVNGILRQAVFPEAGLAGKNVRAERRYKQSSALAAGLGVFALFAGSFYWFDRQSTNLALAQEVLERTRDFSESDLSGPVDPTGASYLDPLGTLREATFTFGDYANVNPVGAQLSLYQGGKIGPIADTAYRTVLNEQFAPTLVAGLAQRLRDVCPKGSDAELDLLRVYRMLGDLEGRDNRVVSSYFTALWQQAFIEDAAKQTALGEHLNHMLNRAPQAYDIDEMLLASSHQNLSGLAPFQRVYASLRALAERQLPTPLEFRASTGAAFDIVYEARETANNGGRAAADLRGGQENDPCGVIGLAQFERDLFEIPRFFTKKEFFDFFLPQNERVARVAADDLWVLGQLETTEYSEADYDAIQDALREAYIDDYIDVWRDSLNAMRVRPFNDIRDANTILFHLSSNNNPIRRIAQFVRDNTEIYENETVLLDEEAAAATDLPFDPDREAGLRINASFAAIHRMLDETTEAGATNLEEVQVALVALYDYVKSVHDAPSPNARALELAIQRAELKGDDPIFVLQRIAERAPAPFDTHLQTVAQQSWQVIMSAATEELNRRWHQEIYGEYQRLIAGKYPFDRASASDIPLDDFETFFRPGGLLDTFYNEELLTFVDETTGQPREIDGQSLVVDPEFTRQLRSAIEITRNFFDQDGEVSLSFQASTVSISSNLSRAILNFEGQLVSSSHGPSRPITIVWPNIIDGPVASRIDVSPLRGSRGQVARQWDGPWSWLRLYDSASKSNLSNNSVDISFGNADGQSVTFRLRAEARVNLFFNSPLTDFGLPAFLRGEGAS